MSCGIQYLFSNFNFSWFDSGRPTQIPGWVNKFGKVRLAGLPRSLEFLIKYTKFRTPEIVYHWIEDCINRHEYSSKRRISLKLERHLVISVNEDHNCNW